MTGLNNVSAVGNSLASATFFVQMDIDGWQNHHLSTHRTDHHHLMKKLIDWMIYIRTSILFKLSDTYHYWNWYRWRKKKLQTDSLIDKKNGHLTGWQLIGHNNETYCIYILPPLAFLWTGNIKTGSLFRLFIWLWDLQIDWFITD